MFLRLSVRSAATLALLALISTSLLAQTPEAPAKKKAATDLDAFMERVLAKREVNRKVLNDYVLDEKEVFEILGPARTRLHRTSREYTWFVRDGMHVRSPLRFEGVTVPDDQRVAFEQRWIEREKARIARKEKQEREKQKEDKHIAISPTEISTNVLPTEPRFVSEAYFMDFKFEPGNYFLAGREELSGQEVLKIEYYPTRMFGGRDDEKTPREMKKASREDRRERELEQDIERKMNKTALVTLWVDLKEHQIVKYTFDNVWMDFLPGAWLVRVDEIRASMTMFQPFEGVWLPRGIEIAAGITLANGSFAADYERSFSDYRQAEVKSIIRIPKGTEDQDPQAEEGAEALEAEPANEAEAEEAEADGGPADSETHGEDAADVLQTEVIREIRVHGNAAVPDTEVLRIAGLAVGAPVDAALLEGAERRLNASGRFETIQIRKRYRSLSDPTDVAIVLVVHEKTGVVATPTGNIERPVLKRITQRIMFLPILSYADGYGFTYGARFSTVDLLGAGERLSLPVTWGGTRRVALEGERTFKRGPLTRLFGSAALWQRENPGFALESNDDDSTTDRRIEFRGRAERNFVQTVFTGFEATRASVDFGPFPRQDQWTIGVDAALDTRGNPAFPANAIYLGAGWNELHVERLDPINRYTLDARGYLRVIGQPVLAARAQYFSADATLPAHERWLVGGSSSLRGFRAGALNGDKAVITSAELRVPMTSVVSGGKLGVTVFADAAKVGDERVRLAKARWHRSAGAGLFLIASIVRINIDVARELRKGGGTRLHLASGFAF